METKKILRLLALGALATGVIVCVASEPVPGIRSDAAALSVLVGSKAAGFAMAYLLYRLCKRWNMFITDNK